jgi:hypothetical protein
MLRIRGFSPRWAAWIMKVVMGGYISISLNDECSAYFHPGKGLKQGDPLSPLLFNLVVDVFTRLLIKAARKEYIVGLMDSLYPEGIISLQYADDTLLFLKHDYQVAWHLTWLLVCFEKRSGMKINYNKNDLVPINLDEEETKMYARIFCCKLGSFPFKYPGVPLHHEKLRREDTQPVVDSILNRIPRWQGRLMSYGARLELLKTCLASIPIYLMSIIRFPKWAIKMINSHMANFFWDDLEGKHKYHLSNWGSIAQKKEHGGLGAPDLRDLNLCLLASWIQRYQNADSKIWWKVVDKKYQTCSPNILCCVDRNRSPFWKGV